MSPEGVTVFAIIGLVIAIVSLIVAIAARAIK